jgi:Secretion system C-terminal sorting domain
LQQINQKFGAEKFKRELRTFIFLLVTFIVLLITVDLFSQNGCPGNYNFSMPPTPYSEGYLMFDGKGDFVRTSDLYELEFASNLTDSFTITTSFKLTRPFTQHCIFGKFYQTGWALCYGTDQAGYVSICIGGVWKNVYYLGADTLWHTYKISYNKQNQTLRTYADGSLTNTYTDFTYASLENNAAFSAGNVNLPATFGPGSVTPPPGYWFKGSIDYIKIKVNNDVAVNYGFNEGVGQIARDSAGYYYSDRTYPGNSTCGITHMMLGFMPANDSCDPEWVREVVPEQTRFTPLGTGTEYFISGPGGGYQAEHSSICMTVWNGYLINGGVFNTAGGIPAKNIAKWDGSGWSNLGGGLNHEPLGLTVFHNELYVTGLFDTAYGFGFARYIAKWNGASWHDVGGGFNNVGTVLKVFQGELIAGGFFNSAGETYAPSIARWNGVEWRSMGIGMTGPVYALEEFGGYLYAAGSFQFAGTEECNSIARWDGTKWDPVGAGISGGGNFIFDLTVYNGSLYAGGSFTEMNNISCSNIARFDGTKWHPLGTGAGGYFCSPSNGYINDMKVCAGELYAGGMFTEIGGIDANKIAKFNGNRWCQVEYGLDMRPRSMEVYNNDLIINGDFYSASGILANNVVKYTPVPNLTGSVNNSTMPGEFSLMQNYPNPFNPTTKIKYSVKRETSNVKLVIYDVTGKEIAALVNQAQRPGIYETEFSGSGLSSGVYYYSLLVDGERIDTKKMAIIK